MGLTEAQLEQLETAGLLRKGPKVRQFVDSGTYASNRVLSGNYVDGFPIRSISEIMGESSSGKTAFLSAAMGAAQAQGYYVIMCDNESSFQPDFAKIFNVNYD